MLSSLKSSALQCGRTLFRIQVNDRRKGNNSPGDGEGEAPGETPGDGD